MNRTPQQLIAHMEAIGAIDPTCPMCDRLFYPSLREGNGVPFAPGHKPSRNCESGRKPHCSCDRCF